MLLLGSPGLDPCVEALDTQFGVLDDAGLARCSRPTEGYR